jgi:hypothetical protein
MIRSIEFRPGKMGGMFMRLSDVSAVRQYKLDLFCFESTWMTRTERRKYGKVL